MFKKRRAVAPGFRLPPPYNPLAGQHKGLARPTDPSRITTMRVKEIHDDYLVCEGWDPDNHVYHLDHKVAKPMALRRNPVKTVLMRGESEEDPDTELAIGESRYDQVYPPYFVGELLVAAKMVGVVGGAVAVPVVSEAEGEAEGGVLLTPEDQTLPDGMPYEGMAVNSEGETVVDEVPVTISEGYPVFWIDLNVAGRTWGEFAMVLNKHTGATRFETHDLVPLSQPYEADDDDDSLIGGGAITRWIAKHKNPRYASWGVALEPIEPDEWGRVAVSGFAIARINHDPSVTITNILRAWLDVHPNPDTEAGDNPRWGLERAHGKAKIVKRFYVDPEGGGDREYYAAINLDSPRHFFAVQAVETCSPGTSVDCVTGHTSEPNIYDTVTVEWDYHERPLFAVARDAENLYTGTCGMAQWVGNYNEDETTEPIYKIIQWPDEFSVVIQSDFDSAIGPTQHVSAKLYCDATLSGVGDAITDIPVAFPGHGMDWKTVHGSEGDVGILHVTQGPIYLAEYWLDAGSWLDEPYGTIRMITGVTVSGTGPYDGWKWCDGTNATPDLRDKFIVGQGSNHTLGSTGGHATHGGGTNDHAEHGLTTGSAQTGAGATAASAITTNHGAGSTETDNEPPWYAVAFAKRVKET